VQGPVQGRHTRERNAALGILDKQAPEHPKLIGNAGMHDGVIDVADDHVAAVFGWNEYLTLRLHPQWLLENKVHGVPEIIHSWFRAGM
jgi:hypothetical protein